MSKKYSFFLYFSFVLIMLKAQNHGSIQPGDSLSEGKIEQLIKTAKKNGVKQSELQSHRAHLYQLLAKQREAKAKGFSQERTVLSPPQVMAGCTNPGFEDGTTNGWTLNQGSNSTGTNLPCPTCISAPGGVYQVTGMGVAATVNINAGNTVGSDASATCICSLSDCSAEPYNAAGVDRFGGFPVVAPAPLGGAHSLMLNNSNCGYLMQQATQAFSVSSSNSIFTYQYAIVLQDGGHPANQSSYFSVTISDVATGTLVPCAQFSACAAGATSGNLAGWNASTIDNTVYYKPWTTATIDLTAYIGRTVSVAFTVSDCNQSGHFGYAYIDASCNNLQAVSNYTLCNGQSVTLSGLPGMTSYNWSGPLSGTAQTLLTSTAGSYTLNTANGIGCPGPSSVYNVFQSGGVVPNIQIHASKDTICSGDTIQLTASGLNTYSWSTSANTSTISVSPNFNTIYTVTGMDDTSGCSNAASLTVHVHPGLGIQVLHDTICNGQSAVLTASGASSYTWSTNAGNQSTPSVSVTPFANTSYTVTGKDTLSGCVSSASTMVYVQSCSTGLEQMTANEPIRIYPNPANGIIYVACKAKNAGLLLTDIIGNKIKEIGIESEITSIDSNSLQNGIYFLSIKTGMNTITKKIMIQH